MIDYENYPVIAAVRTQAELCTAMDCPVETVFLLHAHLSELDAQISMAKEHGKKLFLHMDFIEGLSKDAHGVSYLAKKQPDGMISTRSNLIVAARELGLCTIQRFFMVDSRSVDTALESIRQTRADMIEIMPGIAYKAIATIQNRVCVPIIAGGLIDSKEEIYHALAAGASAVSTGKQTLWEV